MDNTLAGVSQTICYIDDILVAGKDERDHLKALAKVFERLSNAGFKLNKRKCQFARSSVTCLGHVIDGNGLHATADKLKLFKMLHLQEMLLHLRYSLDYLCFIHGSYQTILLFLLH